MFHDVIDSTSYISGFQNSGALIYKLDIPKFESIISFCGNNVVYTFDDGGISFYDVIAPILDRNRLTGIFCITTSMIGSDGFMNSSQIKSLNDSGHQIISHSHSHFSDIAFRSKETIANEWRISKEIIESITEKECLIASIPAGSISFRLLNILEEVGYKEVYTSIPFKGSFKFKSLIIYGRFAIYRGFDSESLSRIDNFFYRLYLNIRFFIFLLLRYLLGEKYYILRNFILKKIV